MVSMEEKVTLRLRQPDFLQGGWCFFPTLRATAADEICIDGFDPVDRHPLGSRVVVVKEFPAGL